MDSLIYLLFALMISFYIVYFLFRKKIIINNKLFKYSKLIHFISASLLLFNLIISTFDYTLRNPWTIKIIMWLFLLTSFVIQFSTKELKTKAGKSYFKILFYAPSLLIITWVIPMLGAYTCYSFMLLFNTYPDNVMYNDSHYKLKYDEGFLLYNYDLDIYKKTFIFEKKIESIVLNERNYDKILSVKELDNKLTIQFQEYDSKNIKDTILYLNKRN